MNSFLKITALSAFVCMLASCEDERFEGTVTGTATAETTAFHNGDEVKVKLGSNVNIQIVRISGIEYPPILHYEIDGEEVATSRDWRSYFEASFTAKDLTPGEHTLSVSVPVIYANIDYNIQILDSKVMVLE